MLSKDPGRGAHLLQGGEHGADAALGEEQRRQREPVAQDHHHVVRAERRHVLPQRLHIAQRQRVHRICGAVCEQQRGDMVSLTRPLAPG